MSYDFMMMKPKLAIRSVDDLTEEALTRQAPETIVGALDALFPHIVWQRTPAGGWFGSLQGEDGWYELRIDATPEYTWSVATSHGAAGRSLIPVICRALGVIAFDGQANQLLTGEET